MPFRFSSVETQALPLAERSIEDLRNAPIANRGTKFRLLQQNMIAYTFGQFVPGWGSPGINSMPFKQVISQPVANARDEGSLLYGADFEVSGNAVAKVTGDVYEVLTAAVLWETCVRWNTYMCGGTWSQSPRYPKPSITPSPRRQVAVLNLPRRYDWVKLLTQDATDAISQMRDGLSGGRLLLPTSTPDIAVVVLPDSEQGNSDWRKPLGGLKRSSQRTLSQAHAALAGRIEPGEIILAIALKSSLRSDRLYQPLYEANIMQLLLEGHLGAPQVDFEVHTLDSVGTDAINTYRAVSLHTIGSGKEHRAIRELYVPQSAQEMVRRFLDFLNLRMDRVPWEPEGQTTFPYSR